MSSFGVLDLPEVDLPAPVDFVVALDAVGLLGVTVSCSFCRAVATAPLKIKMMLNRKAFIEYVWSIFAPEKMKSCNPSICRPIQLPLL